MVACVKNLEGLWLATLVYVLEGKHKRRVDLEEKKMNYSSLLRIQYK